MKTNLSHVRANVRDLDTSIAWYESTLGFECGGKDVNERWAYADFITNSGAVFAIAVDENVPSHGRFNFDVDDVNGLWDKLKDNVNVVQAIETMSYGTRKFTIADLDGNQLGFVQQNYKEVIEKDIDSHCGLHCTGCSFKQTHGCRGCVETQGHPFHGECPVATCCIDKGFLHCGQCSEIPCELLTSYSCDPVHGDTPHGTRIEQCRKWAEPLVHH